VGLGYNKKRAGALLNCWMGEGGSMDREIVTYALVRYCWGEGEDHLDCFWPFAVRSMSRDGKPVDLPYIKGQLKAQFELDVPLHSLSAILRRAEQGGYVHRTPSQYPVTETYSLSEKGLAYQENVEAESGVERRMNALFVDIRQFLSKEFNLSVSENDISIALLVLMRRNIEPLVEFFNPSVPSQEPLRFTTRLSRLGNYIARYMEVADREKPEHYKTLRDIVLGAILTTVLNVPDITKVTKGKALKLKGHKLFLDSNYIFSILGLHEKEFSEAAKELFSLLKSHKFNLRVFSFTIDEICRVMNGYITEGDKYPVSFTVENSTYSKLKRDRWTKEATKEFIMSIEQTLKDMGIETEIVADVDLDRYVASSSLRSAIDQRKPMQPLSSQNHDLAAIDKIKALRKYPVRRLEHAKVLFLTSDRGLKKFNLIDMGHKANGTIGEVMLDSVLTNIIWLGDPGANLSLKSIIAAHSHGLFMKREVWLKFYEALKKIRQAGKVDDQAISTLFYNDFIKKELIDFDQTRLDEINEDFALHEVEKASKLAKADQEKRESELISRLTKAQTKAEREEQAFLEKLEAIKMKLRKSSFSTGSKMSVFFSVLLSVGLGVAGWFLYEVVGMPWLVAIFAGGALSAIWTKFRRFCSEKITLMIYARKLKEIGLSDVAKSSPLLIGFDKGRLKVGTKGRKNVKKPKKSKKK
jgi:DNA-binding MarR family transcriptional regulator